MNTQTNLRTKAVLKAFIWPMLICMILPASLHATVTSSTGDGDWSNASTWDNGVPSAADSVVITDNTIVTLDVDAECEHLLLEKCTNSLGNTGLIMSSGKSMTINDDLKINGDGDGNTVIQVKDNADIDMAGNLIFNASTASTAYVDMDFGSGKITIEGSLKLSSAGKIRSSSESKIIFDGSSQSLDASSNTEFNDITINAGSIVTLNNAISSTEISGDLIVKGGTFDNGGNSVSGGSTFRVQSNATYLMKGGTGLPGSFTHDIQSGAILEYGGSSQTINMPNNSQNFANLTISGTGTKSLGEAVTVDGDLTISSQTLDANGNNLTVKGDWLNNGGSFTAGSASVTFNGSSQQEIKSNGEAFNNVTFNNSSNFTLNGVMTVDGSCTMTDGVVSTGTDTLVLKSTTASDLSGHSSSSFVNGYLKRFIGSNTSTYDFPVGDGTQSSNYYLAEMINNNLSGMDYLSASYINVSNSDDDNIDTEHISPDDTITYANLVRADGVWMLEPDNQPTSGDYNLKCHLDNYNNNALEDNDIGIVKRALGSSNNGANWSAAGDINAKDGNGRLVSDGYVLSKNIGSFSEFGVGGGSSTTALPIELLDFSANLNEDKVQLEWVTATETNNDYFSIQRSEDGSNYETIARVDGAGNSSTKQYYSEVDKEPLTGTSYYRLKQTDKNGNFSYSNIVTVSYNRSNPDIKVSPNPVQKGNSIQMKVQQLSNDNNEEGKVKIYKAVTGELVSEFELTNTKTSYDLPPNVNNGVYLIKGNIGQASFSRKLVIQ